MFLFESILVFTELSFPHAHFETVAVVDMISWLSC